MKLHVLVLLVVMTFSFQAKAEIVINLPFPFYSTTTIKTPTVFRMDKNPIAMEVLDTSYPKSLMNVCKNDMQIALQVWKATLKQMQSYAQAVNFPLDGTKMWIKVYCNKKGKIKHIAFLPTPDSKNIPEGFTEGFLERFMKKYKMQIKAKMDFSHYGIASFPL